MLHRVLPGLLIHTAAPHLIRLVNLSSDVEPSVPFPRYQQP